MDDTPADQPRPFTREREISVFRNGFGELFNDDVRSPRGVAAQYLRWVWSTPGVVAVPRLGDRLAFVTAYRYPIGRLSLEFPRGGVEPGESTMDGAGRELREEAGLAATRIRRLGTVFADTGLIGSPVDVFVCEVDATALDGTATPEEMESIGSVAWLSSAAVTRAIATGQIVCGVTLASLGLLRSLDWPAPASGPAG